MTKIIFSFLAAIAVSTAAMAQGNSKTVSAGRNAVRASRDSALVQTGFSVYPRKFISGAISSLPASKFKNLLPQNFKSVLQGQVAGVHVVQANGGPGSDVTLRVRGTSSVFGESEPLFVIDGVPVYSGPREIVEQGVGGNWGTQYSPLSDFNLDDVESIEVLKDAASTAIYGARGGNGVILITTKKGTRNKSEVNFNFYQGVTNATRTIKSLNGPQYLTLMDESGTPLPGIAGFNRARADTTDSNHMDQILDNGLVRQFNLSTSYNNEKTSFYLSGSYRNEEGILTGNDLDRYTMRVKVTNQIGKRLNIGINSAWFFTNFDNMPVGYSPGGGFNAAQTNLPVFPFINANNTYFYPLNPAIYNLPGSNVAAFQKKGEFNNNESSSRFLLATNFTFNLARNLNFITDVAMEKFANKRASYLSKRMRNGSIGSGAGREGLPTAYSSYEKYSNNLYNLHSVLSYKKAVGEHLFTALGGFEYNYSENPLFFAEGEGYTNDYVREPSTADYKNQLSPLAYVANTSAFLGYFVNVNYEFKGKYLAGLTVRRDGSSRFGANNKYVTTPALSVGWIMSQEDFLNKSKFINYLKLRASYGQTGNSGIGNYSSLERWSLNVNSRYLLQAGIQLESVGSPALKPERLDQFDLGIDYSILNKRISGTVDFYDRVTRNMIVNYMLPLSIGATQSSLLLNAGSLRNRGIEFSISSRNMIGKGLNWNTDLVISHNSNKLLDLGGASADQLNSHKNIITGEGLPVGTFYLANYAGVDPTNGQELIYDVAGNKVAASSAAQIDAARVIQKGKPSAPKFFGGLNNTLSYKNFDLSALLTFSYGNYVLDEGERDLSYLRGMNNLRANAMNRWTSQQPDTDYPRLIYNDPVSGSNTTRFLHDASYLRMKNLTLGYSLKSLTKQVRFIKGARVYVSAQNLFTVTKFKGWDPEVVGNYNAYADRNLNQGITYMDLPQVRTFAAGINLNF